MFYLALFFNCLMWDNLVLQEGCKNFEVRHSVLYSFINAFMYSFMDACSKHFLPPILWQMLRTQWRAWCIIKPWWGVQGLWNSLRACCGTGHTAPPAHRLTVQRLPHSRFLLLRSPIPGNGITALSQNIDCPSQSLSRAPPVSAPPRLSGASLAWSCSCFDRISLLPFPPHFHSLLTSSPIAARKIFLKGTSEFITPLFKTSHWPLSALRSDEAQTLSQACEALCDLHTHDFSSLISPHFPIVHRPTFFSSSYYAEQSVASLFAHALLSSCSCVLPFYPMLCVC